MTGEDAKDMAQLYMIHPELSCQCDSVHVCQQCSEDFHEQMVIDKLNIKAKKKDMKDLKKPLEIKDIDFRVQSINNGKYATILAYKDARVDMNRLDEVVGAQYWKREHFDDNTRCKVSIWNKEIQQWVSKEDIGTASMTEAEKGLASDSFKRACFNWGIGRELYDYPVIQIKLNEDEVLETGKPRPKYKASYNLNLKKWKWHVELDDKNKVTFLGAKDERGKLRFSFGKMQTK